MCQPIAGSTANCEVMASLAVAYEISCDILAALSVPIKCHELKTSRPSPSPCLLVLPFFLPLFCNNVTLRSEHSTITCSQHQGQSCIAFPTAHLQRGFSD